MKKVAIFLFILLIILSLNGCSKTPSSSYSSNPASSHTIYDSTQHNSRTYNFSSYDDLCQSLENKQSSLRTDSQQTNYGSAYNDFLALLDNNGSTVKVPTYDGVPMTIEGNAEWQKITLFTEELYGLPWIWYYCKYQENTIVVATTYCDLLGLSTTDTVLNFEDILNNVIPDAPSPKNFEKYATSYDSICTQPLIFSETKTIPAVVLDSADSARVYYSYVYGNMIVSMWIYEGGEIPSEFWTHFSLGEYQ